MLTVISIRICALRSLRSLPPNTKNTGLSGPRKASDRIPLPKSKSLADGHQHERARPLLALPQLVTNSGEQARIRFLEFFTANIRNRHTRRSYARTAVEFMTWCESAGLASLADVQPVHVAAYIEQLTRNLTAPTAKQRLAAIRHLFDWLVVGQVVRDNPAASVRGPSHRVRKSKTPVLDAKEVRELLDSIDVSKPVGLRDRALVALMVYSFARVGAATAMRVEDAFVQNRRLWVRLHEKGGKLHEMPCHHNLEAYLHAYIDGCGLAADPKEPLFRTIGRKTGVLTQTPLDQSTAYRMVTRRARAVGLETKICNHTFRGTGITTYLKNAGKLEGAQDMANHASIRTTQLYDRRRDEVNLDEVERIVI
jgi:site-specific recombinase XerD